MTVDYPDNGIDVVQGEVSALMSSMRKAYWSRRTYQEDENNPLLKNLSELENILSQISDLKEIEPITFLGPFLEVIKSNETTIAVTILALNSVDKFISYGLIGGISDKYLLPVIENIANTLANSHSFATDILMEIVEVSRTLVMSPLGRQLTNDSVCNIMLRCFKICFETHFDEKLRRNAEHCLKRIVELLFRRLPDFIQTSVDKNLDHNKKMRIRSRSNDVNQKKKSSMSKVTGSKNSVSVSKGNQDGSVGLPNKEQPVGSRPTVPNHETQTAHECDTSDPNLVTGQTEDSPLLNDTESQHQAGDGENEIQGSNQETVDYPYFANVLQENNADPPINNHEEAVDQEVSTADDTNFHPDVSSADKTVVETSSKEKSLSVNSSPLQATSPIEEASNSKQYVNSQGVRFTSDDVNSEEYIPLEPHNSICVQELFRFLTVICNPHDEQSNDVMKEEMKRIGLSLITIALEVGADAISRHPMLLTIVKDTLCRNLLALMNMEKPQIFVATLNVSFLLFKSMRCHLKFQMESFLSRLSEIIATETAKVSYEKKEFALKCLVRLWKIPGLSTELFINYDCDLYCSNLYEEITKLLSKNVYPVAEIYRTHLLSLDALLTIVDSIEKHCHSCITSDTVMHEQTADSSSGIAANSVACAIVSKEEDHSSTVVDEKQEASLSIPSHEQLMIIKRKKDLLTAGTVHFNANPKKGIQFLQEQGLLSTPLEPLEVAKFLRENPHLDKKQIGEYISHRSNLQILEQFVKSFDFTDMRIDEALRLYLEAFRLPGESPLISEIMQKFADHWHISNNEPFSKSDAAFVLAYAIILLNVDQHNQVVRRQHTPMTLEDFKKNLKGTDDGRDFDQDLLEAIYHAIKNEEIVMPAEHTGLVRENYLWEVLLRRGATKDGVYIRAKDGAYDHELFTLCWGPVVTALSYVFDKSTDSAISYKSVQGFRKCATISAHYGMSNEFDNLTLSLCKFTMLLNPVENPESFTVSFGMNAKARLAARTVFNLVHRHGDILREGWRPVFDCIFQLFRCKLLPKILVEGEDFLELSGKVSLIREDDSSQKTMESGLLSSLYSYITLATDASSQRINNTEEQECIEVAKTCITDCHLENLILESKFLRLESLHELLKVLIRECYNTDNVIVVNTKQDEDKAIFFLELLLKVVIQNRDRISSLWPMVHNHLHTLLMVAATSEQQFLIERCVIGLLRLAIRLMRRDEISSAVLQSLRMLLLLKWSTLHLVSRQISYGLYELVKTGAANIHSETDWAVIFTLFEVVGAGAPLPKPSRSSEDTLVASNDGRSSEDTAAEGVSEDSGLDIEKQSSPGSDSCLNQLSLSTSPSSYNSYLSLNDCDDRDTRLFYSCHDLLPHDPFSLVKCCESLAFLVRDVAHITPFNFRNCVHTMRTFVEATLYPGERKTDKKKTASSAGKNRAKNKTSTWKKGGGKYTSQKNQNSAYDADESDPEEYPDSYFQVPLQLLDLMHTLYTKTADIHNGWTKENQQASSLWPYGWCPLLQGIARLCCDPRKSVRMSAVTYLQRSLLMLELRKLKANEWESCFNDVLFPLLEELAEPFQGKDSAGVEETRMRAATLLSKVFLHHLSHLSTLRPEEQPLENAANQSSESATKDRSVEGVAKEQQLRSDPKQQSLKRFTELWLRILELMHCYMRLDESSDLLVLFRTQSHTWQSLGSLVDVEATIFARMTRNVELKGDFKFQNEAIQESVKNMILVMKSPVLSFSNVREENQFWISTWERVDKFMPKLRDELERYHSTVQKADEQFDEQFVPPLAAAESPTSEFRDPKSVKTRASPEEVVEPPKHSDVTLVKHSVPIFPHMGQLISTPIGPPYQRETFSREDTGGVENATHSDTQMSSLIASAPDFLASLPSFRAQSPPIVCSPGTQSPPMFARPVSDPEANVLHSQYSSSVSPDRAYSPTYPSAILSADPAVAGPVNANVFPYFMQRSSSVCEASAPHALWRSNVAPELRTESYPVLSQQTYSSLDESRLAANMPSGRALGESYSAENTTRRVPESLLVSSTCAPVATEASSPGGERGGTAAADPNTQPATASSETSPQSPIKLAFPVYSGFAQLGADAVGNMEESSAKQFFYQNWYVK